MKLSEFQENLMLGFYLAIILIIAFFLGLGLLSFLFDF